MYIFHDLGQFSNNFFQMYSYFPCNFHIYFFGIEAAKLCTFSVNYNTILVSFVNTSGINMYSKVNRVKGTHNNSFCTEYNQNKYYSSSPNFMTYSHANSLEKVN